VTSTVTELGLAQNTVQWRAGVKSVMDIREPANAEIVGYSEGKRTCQQLMWCIDHAVALLLAVTVLRNVEQDRETTYNTTLRCVRVTAVAVRG
jgi:hypothetical protein